MAVTGYNENPPIPPLEKGGKDKIMSNRRITESVVEEAALSWFEELGYAVLSGPDIALGELF